MSIPTATYRKDRLTAMNQFTLQQRKMIAYLVMAATVLIVICLVAALTLGVIALVRSGDDEGEQPDVDNNDVDTEAPNGDDTPSIPTAKPSRVLGATADMGQAYIDSMIFVGESTTAHLRSRGVLTGGKSTKQVWSNESNTMALDLNILQKTINYPETGQAMTIPAAAAVARPKYIVLNFGVNGIQTFGKNEKLYSTAYGKLIDAIHEASPDTVVLLQTVYPVAANQATFHEGAATINGYIKRLNELLPDIATAHNAYVVDTASVLVGSDGNLRSDYQTGDGIHLTTEAYVQILNYLRTHGYTN
ncbi:MAG: hypothetical protein E7605_08690 [Ruminococcaceae bacterium]|nr:hypothetical protein [Oscillospiraceae bacterium]